jgi:hypothetical protein
MGEPGKIASLHHGREELEYTKTFSAFDFSFIKVRPMAITSDRPCSFTSDAFRYEFF